MKKITLSLLLATLPLLAPAQNVLDVIFTKACTCVDSLALEVDRQFMNTIINRCVVQEIEPRKSKLSNLPPDSTSVIHATTSQFEPLQYAVVKTIGKLILECDRFAQQFEDFQKLARQQIDTTGLAALIVKLDAILQLDSTASAFYDRGICYYKLQQPDKAYIDFEKAIALDTSMGQAYQYRGFIKEQRGDFKGALEDFIRCQQLTLEMRIDFFINAVRRKIAGEPNDEN